MTPRGGALPLTATLRVGPPLALFLLAPLVGEVLFGALPLSMLPSGLLGVAGLYGGGALLVREAVRRRRLSGAWLVLLGVAYGLVEEGSVVQSLFDSHYHGLDFLGFYGHWAGVNWVWALFIVPYHAVFSIAIPIALAELGWPERSGEPWLDRFGLAAAGLAFTVNAVLLAVFETHLFSPQTPEVSASANIVALLVAAGIMVAAFLAPPGSENWPIAELPPASPRRLRVIGLLSGLAWFIGFRVLVIGTGTTMPAAMALLCGASMAALIAWRLVHWSGPRRPWTVQSTYALVSGALPTSWLLGLLIAAISGGDPVVNLAGHVLFGGLLFAGLHWLRTRSLRNTQPGSGQPDTGA